MGSSARSHRIILRFDIRTLVRPDNNNDTVLRVNPKVFIEVAVRFVVGLVVEEYLVQVYLMSVFSLCKICNFTDL